MSSKVCRQEEQCECLQVDVCWHNWLIVWGARQSSSHNKIRTSWATERPATTSGVISWSTQINCHLIWGFPGFVVASGCQPPGRSRSIINNSNVFSSLLIKQRTHGPRFEMNTIAQNILSSKSSLKFANNFSKSSNILLYIALLLIKVLYSSWIILGSKLVFNRKQFAN